MQTHKNVVNTIPEKSRKTCMAKKEKQSKINNIVRQNKKGK